MSILETNRLSIKPLEITDWEFIKELVNTPGWIQFIGERNVRSKEDAEAYVQRIIDNPATNYSTVRLKDNTPVGLVTLIQRTYLTSPDIGYAFLPQHAGNGYAYEAAITYLNHFANNDPAPEIFAVTLRENDNSIKLLTKLGLYFERQIEVDNETLDVFRASKDELLINEISQKFFGLFTNTNGKKPDLDLLYNLCIPETTIIKKEKEIQEVFTLDSFIAPRKKILTDGTLKDFQEKEIKSETRISGNIGQRYCEYVKSGIKEGKSFQQKGHKMIHFLKTSEGWKISSVLWEDDKIDDRG